MTAAARSKIHVAVSSFVLFCVALFLTAYSAKNPSFRQIGSALMLTALSPVQAVGETSLRGIGSLWRGYLFLIGVQQENVHIKKRLSLLETQNAQLLELKHENDRLRGLLGVVQESEIKGTAARVVAYDPSNWTRTITIDKGADVGIVVGMPVIEGSGIVGQVVAVGPAHSRVLLITDHASGVDAFIQDTRVRGVIEGAGDRICRLRFVSSDDEVKIGDRVVSSGMDGVFPKGLLLGVVTDSRKVRSGLFQLVEVQPTVDFLRLEDVLVITNLSTLLHTAPAQTSSGGGRSTK